jgi:hypothetical protein
MFRDDEPYFAGLDGNYLKIVTRAAFGTAITIKYVESVYVTSGQKPKDMVDLDGSQIIVVGDDGLVAVGTPTVLSKVSNIVSSQSTYDFHSATVHDGRVYVVGVETSGDFAWVVMDAPATSAAKSSSAWNVQEMFTVDAGSSSGKEPSWDQGMEVIRSIGGHLVIGGGWHHFNSGGSGVQTYYEKPAIWVMEK